MHRDPTACIAGAVDGMLYDNEYEELDMHPRHLRLRGLCLALAALVVSDGTQASAAGNMAKIEFAKDAIRPTATQAAAIRRAAASDIAEFIHHDQKGYVVAEADLNDDGRPDLLVQYDDIAFCGASGCSGVIVMATANGYSGAPIDLPNFYGEIDILPSSHQGMHDLRYGDSPVWVWNGKEYGVAKADMPGADAPSWETRQGAGRTVALAAPTESVIKTVSVFCNQGTPVLAMVVKARPPAGPVTMTWIFRGWTVNVPMVQGNRDATLWMSDLSRSELPLWLAHRGNTSTTSELSRLATESFLRINGGMQGEVSLKNSASATQAALGSCYRY